MSEPSLALRRYAKLAVLLDAIDQVGAPMAEGARDRIADTMDAPWLALSDEERAGINDGTIDLSSLGLDELLREHPL